MQSENYSNEQNTEMPELEGSMTSIELMKSLMSQKPDMTLEEIKNYRQDILDFFNDFKGRYYMLLSNEIHYYTIFDTTKCNNDSDITDKFINFIVTDEFLNSSYGSIKNIEINYDLQLIEFWFGTTYFAFFVCDDFILDLDEEKNIEF